MKNTQVLHQRFVDALMSDDPKTIVSQVDDAKDRLDIDFDRYRRTIDRQYATALQLAETLTNGTPQEREAVRNFLANLKGGTNRD